MSKKRKYDESYISFGFTYVMEPDGTQKPQCILCGNVLANGSLKPVYLGDTSHRYILNSRMTMKISSVQKRPNLRNLGLCQNSGFVQHKSLVLKPLTRLLTVLPSKRNRIQLGRL